LIIVSVSREKIDDHVSFSYIEQNFVSQQLRLFHSHENTVAAAEIFDEVALASDIVSDSKVLASVLFRDLFVFGGDFKIINNYFLAGELCLTSSLCEPSSLSL
jgi:hypothetical protein